MGWSRHHPLGLIHSNPQHSYRGYTLLATNRGGYHAHLIDLEGRVCHRWQHPEGIAYGYLLPNGHLLFRSAPPRPGSGETEVGGGQSRSLIELDWDGRVAWEYRSPDLYLHHDFERLPNGNTLILLWTPMPAELTAQVQGGFRTDNDPAQMYGDVVQENYPGRRSGLAVELLGVSGCGRGCHLPPGGAQGVDASECPEPYSGRRFAGQLPPDQHRGDCRPGQRRFQVEVGAGAGLSSASSHLAGTTGG